jgi:hypothetical protein
LPRGDRGAVTVAAVARQTDAGTVDERAARKRQRAAWVFVIVAPILVAVLCIPARPEIPPADRALLLALTVVVAALLGGRLVGAVAALVAAFAFDVFHTRPYYSVRINRAVDIETAALLLVVGVAIGELVTRSRRYRALAGASREELRRVRRLAELAAGGEPPGRLIRVIRNELVEVLGVAECDFEDAPFLDSLPRLRHTGVVFPVALERSADDKARAGTRIELPVWGEGLEIGRFVLTLRSETTGLEFPPDARASALALADQLGVILLAHRR